MAMTRKPQRWLSTFLFSRDAVAISCPECGALLVIGMTPAFQSGYDINDNGEVYPMVVCHNKRDDGTYCPFTGPIQLTMQVKKQEGLVTEKEEEERL